ANALQSYTTTIPLVGRNPKKVNASDHQLAVDLSKRHGVFKATEGSDITYVTIGFPYNAKVWRQHWPPFMQNVIAPCLQHGSKLVFFGQCIRHRQRSCEAYHGGISQGPQEEKRGDPGRGRPLGPGACGKEWPRVHHHPFPGFFLAAHQKNAALVLSWYMIGLLRGKRHKGCAMPKRSIPWAMCPICPRVRPCWGTAPGPTVGSGTCPPIPSRSLGKAGSACLPRYWGRTTDILYCPNG